MVSDHPKYCYSPMYQLAKYAPFESLNVSHNALPCKGWSFLWSCRENIAIWKIFCLQDPCTEHIWASDRTPNLFSKHSNIESMKITEPHTPFSLGIHIHHHANQRVRFVFFSPSRGSHIICDSLNTFYGVLNTPIVKTKIDRMTAFSKIPPPYC